MITYYLSGEHIIVEKYAKDLVVGGTVGAVTGPINLGDHRYDIHRIQSGKRRCKQGVVKLGYHSAVGVVCQAPRPTPSKKAQM